MIKILLNPKLKNRVYQDKRTEEICEKTIEFFENMGLAKVKEDNLKLTWYSEFLDFVKDNEIFADLLTPSKYGGENARWDTWRICQYNEILSFYGLCYWYTWQVSILGLGPIWQSANEGLKQKAAQLLKSGAIFAFGLSEKEHGADIYSTDMKLIPQADGTYKALGEKYYIGNGNKAEMVSTLGKITDSEGNFQEKTSTKDKGDYVWFVANYHNEKAYDCKKNVVATQSYVANYALNDYPITEEEILSTKDAAWDATMNTINIGKFNLGWASIGICTHSFYEALNHASSRILFNHAVTEFTHIKQYFVEAYIRLLSMKLFALRGADYMRVASLEDRRYLLYNPMVKMKVTTQGEKVMDLLFDIIAAKGFEKDTYFEMGIRDIRALPKLEGTVHVNMALVLKFMGNYFMKKADFEEVPKMDVSKNDDFLFNQGPAKNLASITFHDFMIAYDSVDIEKVPNVGIFKEQLELMKEFTMKATPNRKQAEDFHFLLKGGELFALVVYGQLLIEAAKIYDISDDILDQIFDVIVIDFSKYAFELYSSHTASKKQEGYLQQIIKKPIKNTERFERVWKDHVLVLKETYTMNE